MVYRRWKAHDLEAAFPGGETYATAKARMQRALDRAAARPGDVLLVTHGGITRTVLPYLCVNAAALQRAEDLGNTAFIVLEPYDPGRFVCLSWNLAEHLVDARDNGHQDERPVR
jgi:broad specificity phosphatase PhoE